MCQKLRYQFKEGYKLNKQARHITLFMPDLQNIIQSSNTRKFDNLELMLSRGIMEDCVDLPYYTQIAEQLGVVIEGDSFPMAAFELYGEAQSDDKHWVAIASPGLLVPNRSHLTMAQADHFNISEEDAKTFCEEMNIHFQEDELRFIFLNPGRWYCYANKPFTTSIHSPQEIVGQNIITHVPHGEHKMGWQRLFNEAQMLLHHSPTNQKRISEGMPEINHIWFWGGGTLPCGFQSKITNVISNDKCVKNMAKLGGVLASPYNEQQLSNIANLNDSVLMVLTIETLGLSDLTELDTTLFSSLIQALNKKQTDELHVIFEQGKKLVVTRKMLRQFWKRKKGLGHFFPLANDNYSFQD